MDWRKLIGTVAPTIATALGGPLAGMATKALSGALLGKPEGTEKEIADAVAAAGPAELLKLKELEQQFQVEMKKLDIDLEKISQDDRDSARRREMTVRDRTPAVIATLCFVGFFGILGLLIFKEIPASANQALMIMLGSLGTLVTQVAAYYYGSSAGSAAKSKQIENILGR